VLDRFRRAVPEENDMNGMRNALLTGLAIAALGLTATASAHDRHGHRPKHHGHHHKHWHDRHYDHRHAARHHYAPPYVVRERVVVHRPVYVAPPPRYYAPAYPPGVVVSVDIPPIVIPFR
jgi:hypothetical protein